jgi:hypothetical protein
VLNHQGKELTHSDFALHVSLYCYLRADFSRLPLSCRQMLQHLYAYFGHFFIELDVLSSIGDEEISILLGLYNVMRCLSDDFRL